MTHNISTVVPNDIIMGIIAIFGGMGLSFLIVSYFMKNNTDSKLTYIFTPTDEMIQSNKQRQKIVSYGNNFYDELEELDDRELSDEELTNLFDSIIEEETPEGKIIMRYNTAVQRYEYFCDNKNVSNRILDAVCRKYTITYNCKKICLNHRKEIERVREKIQKSLEGTNSVNDEDNSVNSVFINRVGKTTGKVKSKKKVILEKMNYFTRKGNMFDYNEFIEKKKLLDKHVISFSDFKKMQCGNKDKTQ